MRECKQTTLTGHTHIQTVDVIHKQTFSIYSLQCSEITNNEL